MRGPSRRLRASAKQTAQWCSSTRARRGGLGESVLRQISRMTRAGNGRGGRVKNKKITTRVAGKISPAGATENLGLVRWAQGPAPRELHRAPAYTASSVAGKRPQLGGTGLFCHNSHFTRPVRRHGFDPMYVVAPQMGEGRTRWRRTATTWSSRFRGTLKFELSRV